MQSHDLTIGTIPAGVTDDVDDGGGISEPSDICRQTTDPMSHAPASRKCYASCQRVSSTNSMVDPIDFLGTLKLLHRMTTVGILTKSWWITAVT